AFAGIDPRLVESGMHKGKAKMSKRGSRYLRRALHMASFVGMRGDALFRQIYERQRARGKHHFIALSHVQNKLVHVIYSVLKHNRPYVPIEARAVS
ncbi:MAG: transposase, partial [candidate division NC10 bacterium]|nr:transposase [candidate division NC10 bacterium]